MIWYLVIIVFLIFIASILEWWWSWSLQTLAGKFLSRRETPYVISSYLFIKNRNGGNETSVRQLNNVKNIRGELTRSDNHRGKWKTSYMHKKVTKVGNNMRVTRSYNFSPSRCLSLAQYCKV